MTDPEPAPPSLPPLVRVAMINASGGIRPECFLLSDGWLEVRGAMVTEWRRGESVQVTEAGPLGGVYAVVQADHRVYLRPESTRRASDERLDLTADEVAWLVRDQTGRCTTCGHREVFHSTSEIGMSSQCDVGDCGCTQ